jgi:peptidoglycan/xylan/chitin deacetylase (PgdA/CDA1 family)
MISSIHRLVRRAVTRPFVPRTRPRDGLRILTYHRVNSTHPRDRLSVHPDAFAAQMDFLARSGRSVVPVEEALPALRGETALPPDAVALTFDDGFADNFTFAFPVLERHGFRAAFFLPTSHIGSSGTLDHYRACCTDDHLLDWDEVRVLRDAGHAIGGHGHTHRELHTLPDTEARAEIARSAGAIQAETRVRPRLFCYPRGQETAGIRQLVADAGFEAACTVRPGANPPGVDLFGLARTEVSGDDEIDDFELKLAGGFDQWHRLVQGAQDTMRRMGR